MLVCRKSSKGKARRVDRQVEGGPRRKLGDAGPVFYPKRKPSEFVERLLASESFSTVSFESAGEAAEAASV